MFPAQHAGSLAHATRRALQEVQCAFFADGVKDMQITLIRKCMYWIAWTRGKGAMLMYNVWDTHSRLQSL